MRVRAETAMRRLVLPAILFAACQTTTPPPPAPQTQPMKTIEKLAVAADTPQRLTQLPRTVIDYVRSLLNDNERQVVAKLIEASKLIDEIFWRQVSEENPDLREQLPKPSAAYDYLVMNKGPW